MREPATYVFLLGCRGAGKTSFLSGLALLSRGGSDSRFQLVTEDGPTTRMITDLRAWSEQQQWPPPTSSMSPLTFALSYGSPYGVRRFQITVLDYPGEDLLEAMEKLDFEGRRPLEEQFERAAYILVVADPTQDLITPLNTDAVEARRRQDALVQAVNQLIRQRRQSAAARRGRPEIAILISKRDVLNRDKEVSVATIVRKNEPFIRNLTRFSASRPLCFPVTSCGETTINADGHVLPPPAPRPGGYEELFDWLSRRHFWARNRRLVAFTGGVFLLVLLVALGFHFWRQHKEETLVTTIEECPIGEVVSVVQRARRLKGQPADALDRRVRSELERIEKELDGGPTGDRLRGLGSELGQLQGLPPTAYARDLSETARHIETAQEEALFSAIKAEQRTGDTVRLLGLISEYKRGFPAGNHRAEVGHIYERAVGEQQAAARGRVRAIPIINRENLASKAKELRNYLKSYSDDPHAADMGKAASLAESVAATDSLRLRFKGCGFAEAKGKRYHEVRCFINGELRASCEAEAKSAASTFDKVLDVSYADWPSLRIELWDLNWGNEKIAQSDLDVLRDLAILDGKSRFMLTDTGGYWSCAEAYIIIEIQWRKDQGWSPVSAEDLQSYGRFIAPGREW